MRMLSFIFICATFSLLFQLESSATNKGLPIDLTFSTETSMSQNDWISPIKKAFSTADAEPLQALFLHSVEIIINEDYNIHTPKQAKLVLNNFFNKYPPEDFTIDYKGDSNSNTTTTLIATLKTKNDDNFQVYIYLRKVEDTFTINHIRIQKKSLNK